MNGHWAGEMVPNAMMGWAQPPHQPSVMPFQFPYHPQMPQNLQLPLRSLPPLSPFPNPGQPQFFPPGPPSVTSLPSILPGPPYAGSFPPGPSSVSSFPSGPPTIFSSGPPSVASVQKAPTRVWSTPKPKMADAICDQSIAILEPKPKRIKRSLSPDVTLELADETPKSQAQACNLCAPFMPSPPTFSRILAQREHAKVHSGQFQKSLADVFPLCFPDALAPEESDAGREDKEPSLPSNSRSESFDTSLPTPPPPPTPPPAPTPSTPVAPLTTAAPSSPTAPSSSSTAPSSSSSFTTPKKDKVQKGAELSNEAKSLVKKSEEFEDSKEAPVMAVTSGTQSELSEDQAKDSSTVPSSSAKPKSTLKTALASAVKKGGPCYSEQPRRGRKGRLPRCTNAVPGAPALLERHLAKHLGKDLFRCTVPECPSPLTRYKLQHNKSHPGSPKPDYEDLRAPLAFQLLNQLERCIGNKGAYAFKAKKSAKVVKPCQKESKSSQSKTNLNAPTTPKASKKATVTESAVSRYPHLYSHSGPKGDARKGNHSQEVQPPSHTVYGLKNQAELLAASTFAQNFGLYLPTASEIQEFKSLKPDLFNSDQYHWHNEHPLEVRLRSDCKDVSAFATRKCPSCGRKVSEPTVSAPGDLVVLHQERYNRPGGGFWVLTENTGLRVYHAHYACIAGRFPYADLNFLRIKESKSAGNFTPAHLGFLAVMFGFLPEP